MSKLAFVGVGAAVAAGSLHLAIFFMQPVVIEVEDTVPLAVVRNTPFNGAISSNIRISNRLLDNGFADPGFGGCITWQSKLEPDGPDVDRAHLCVTLGENNTTRAYLIMRDSQENYTIVQEWQTE